MLAPFLREQAVDLRVTGLLLDEETFAGGGQIGVNWPSGSFVFGFEVDASGFGNDTSALSTLTYPTNAPDTFTVTNSLEQTWLATARRAWETPDGGG